jgi:acetolactate decarboxylase
MRNTMFHGQLAGLIALDTISTPGTYGIGPLEFLRGELLLWDGHTYVSTAQGDSAMLVEERPHSKAPFFVHQRIAHWTTIALPDSVTDLPTLNAFLTANLGHHGEPVAFRLSGTFTSLDAHLVDVAPGTTINGPDDAHRDNKHYHIADRQADLLGFFSTKHKAVFTHHDTHIHVHAITKERDRMGHLEAARFDPARCELSIALQLRNEADRIHR